jgi:hypothetical protein
VSDRPHWGTTKTGLEVHARVTDHLPRKGMAGRFNAWVAVKISAGVGSMWCAYAFAAVALWGLPGALKPGGEGLVPWIAQTFLQLVLLSVIMVGQGVQAQASDARAGKTFEDAEEAREGIKQALDLLDIHTEGGLAEVLALLRLVQQQVSGVAGAVQYVTRQQRGEDGQ